ncbi:MAG TPA: hypothetical protein VFC19_30605 [Candidatus Limnocylindrales bacterium]|nr:hypothetical protein [Candidatus Limnocylindrales bacterium]
MTYTPPAPPVKRGNNTRTILIVVGVVLGLCCVLGVIGGVFFFRTVGGEMEPVRSAATAYVDDVMAGNYSGAYARMCDKVHRRISEADYTRTQSAQLKIKSYQVVGTNIRTINSTTTATVSMRMVQAETGLEYTQGIFLLKERGQWWVCE